MCIRPCFFSLNLCNPRNPCFSFLSAAAMLLCVLLPGCAHLGQGLQRTPLPPGAPPIEEILDDLATNDGAIQNFKATGTFTLVSPDLAAVQRFRHSTIEFRRPADLFVEGRKYLGSVVFRMRCVGSEFLIEFPASRDEPYYSLEGEEFKSVPGRRVTPAEIAREMFLPEPWGELKPGKVRMTEYDVMNQTAVLEIGPKRAPRRRVVVQGAPWVVVRSERFDRRGNLVAVTARGDYRELEGVRFPPTIEAQFPGEQSSMKLKMRQIWPNTSLDEAHFDISARARALGLDLTQEGVAQLNIGN